MAGKKSAGGGDKHGGGAVSDMEARVPLQAILLADSFAQKFRPITLEKPKVLLPLAGIPLIDYTLEWLSSAGVELVLVFCCAHARQVVDYLENSQWSTRQDFRVNTIVSNNCMSVGDAMRLIDAQNVIRGDFVLVSGDTVSNMSLKEVMEEHRERKRTDKQAVMTMVTKKLAVSKVTQQSRLGNDEHLYVIDPHTKQLLYYDHGHDYIGKGDSWQKPTAPSIPMDMEMFRDRTTLQMRTDLQDCHIDICGPEVLELFTDNFDYQHLRRDFVKGLLNDEITGNKIYTYEIGNEYTARVDNMRAYDAISRDVIGRWTYPIVPDTRFHEHTTTVDTGRLNVGKEEGVVLARTASIGPDVFLGEGTHVGEGSSIASSVLGKHCVIGSNVVIENSYLWEGVRVEDGAVVRSAILCDNVTVRARATVEPGAVLSFRVVIGEGFRVPEYSKISLCQQPEEKDESDDELEYDEAASGLTESPLRPEPSGMADRDDEAGAEAETAGTTEHVDTTSSGKKYSADEVGNGGAGYRWSSREASIEEEWRLSICPIPSEALAQMRTRAKQFAGDRSVALLGPPFPGPGVGGRTRPSHEEEGKRAKRGLGEEEDEEEDEEDEEVFYKEVALTFNRAVFEGVSERNVVFEIKGLKSGFVKSFADCASGIFRAMLDVVFTSNFPHKTPAELLGSIQEVFRKWGKLLGNFLMDLDDQVDVLLTFEEVCDSKQHPELVPLFAKVLEALYDVDVVSEEAILQWAGEKQGADDADKKYLKLAQPLLDWLRDADYESN